MGRIYEWKDAPCECVCKRAVNAGCEPAPGITNSVKFLCGACKYDENCRALRSVSRGSYRTTFGTLCDVYSVGAEDEETAWMDDAETRAAQVELYRDEDGRWHVGPAPYESSYDDAGLELHDDEWAPRDDAHALEVIRAAIEIEEHADDEAAGRIA